MNIKICRESNIPNCPHCRTFTYQSTFCYLYTYKVFIKRSSLKEIKHLIIDLIKRNEQKELYYMNTVINRYFPEYINVFNKLTILK